MQKIVNLLAVAGFLLAAANTGLVVFAVVRGPSMAKKAMSEIEVKMTTILFDKLESSVSEAIAKLDACSNRSSTSFLMSDPVNSPSHYKQGRIEAIEIIEDVVSGAGDTVNGYLLGQTLKYLLRMFHKESPVTDAMKARWYLNRLISRMIGPDA